MKLNRRGFFKRSARVGAVIATSPILIGGKDGGTGPGTAVTEKALTVDLNPGRVTPQELANAALFEASDSSGHRYGGVRRAFVIYTGDSSWPGASEDLGGRRHQPRDERGRFTKC